MQIPVKGLKGVNESLKEFFEYENLDGVFCENCNLKTNSSKGFRLYRIPPILNLSLTRFAFNY